MKKYPSFPRSEWEYIKGLKKHPFICLALAFSLLFAVSPANAKDVNGLFSKPIELKKAPESFQRLSNQFRKQKNVKANFKQIKKIKVLRRPLVSKGNILFVKDMGLIWRIAHPFKSMMIINSSGIYQQRKKELIPMLSVKQNPMARGFMESFLSLFSGDFSKLEEYYRIYYQQDDQGKWKIGFIPKREPHNKIIEKMILQGDSQAFFKTFYLWEKNGDQTEMNFTQIMDSKIELTSEELKTFEASR